MWLECCDTPFRRLRQSRIFSPSLFIQSSARSRSIFQRPRKQSVADFDEQCVSFQKPIHNSLSQVFKVQVDGDSNLVSLLQSIQEQLTNLDITISNLEKGQPKIKPYQGDHQLHYINQSVDSLTSRLEQLLQLDTQKPQVTYNTHLNKFSKVYACKFCPLQFSKACSLGGHISRTHKEQSLQQKLLIKKITKKRKQQI